MRIRFVTIRRIPKNEYGFQKFQRRLKYLWVNSVQVHLSLIYEGHWSRFRNYREGLTYPENCV